MIIIGVDAHKSTHTFVAVDEVGRQVGQLTTAATPDGHLSALTPDLHRFSAPLRSPSR